jgi:polar amino acid transport system substrate-binding protein
MMRRICLGFAMLASTVCLSPLYAEVRLVAGDVPPFVYTDKGSAKGVAYDLLVEMAKRVKHSGKIDIQPFARMVETGKSEANVLVIPLGRNPSREASYQWIANLVDEEFLLVGNAEGKANIASFDNKTMKVGVLRDSVGASIAKSKGFTATEDVTKEEMNAHKLASGRLDAWLGAWNTILQAQRDAGLDVKQLKRGAVASRIGIYLAGPLQLDKAEAEKWKAALDAMKKDGSYDRILAGYHYELPK